MKFKFKFFDHNQEECGSQQIKAETELEANKKAEQLLKSNKKYKDFQLVETIDHGNKVWSIQNNY